MCCFGDLKMTVALGESHHATYKRLRAMTRRKPMLLLKRLCHIIHTVSKLLEYFLIKQ